MHLVWLIDINGYSVMSLHLLNSPNAYGPCGEVQSLDSEPAHVQGALKQLLSSVSGSTCVSRPAWVKSSNSTIKKNAYVVTSHDGHFPVFCMIIDVLVLCDIVVLHVGHCKTDFFDDHHHAYAVLLMYWMALYFMHTIHSTIIFVL